MNDHDNMKKLMETVDGTTKPLTETIINEDSEDASWAALELTDIGTQIEDLVEEARQALRNLGPEARGALSRAEAYWIPHILGALALNSQSTSMTSMRETIEELDKMTQPGGQFNDELEPMETIDSAELVPTVDEAYGDEAFLESDEGGIK